MGVRGQLLIGGGGGVGMGFGQNHTLLSECSITPTVVVGREGEQAQSGSRLGGLRTKIGAHCRQTSREIWVGADGRKQSQVSGRRV